MCDIYFKEYAVWLTVTSVLGPCGTTALSSLGDSTRRQHNATARLRCNRQPELWLHYRSTFPESCWAELPHVLQLPHEPPKPASRWPQPMSQCYGRCQPKAGSERPGSAQLASGPGRGSHRACQARLRLSESLGGGGGGGGPGGG